LLLALIRPQSSQLEDEVNSDIYIVMGIDDILEAAHDLTPSSLVNLYAGYAGWAPGQIETEIAEGDWTVAPLDDGAVLDIPTEDLWRILRTRWKGYWASTIQQPRSQRS
jgi:putative transcriptional regulator